MSRKVYEIAFAIAGKMNGNFGGTFAYASSRISGLKAEMSKLNAEYKNGSISQEQYIAKQSLLSRKIVETQKAQELFNRSLQKQHELTSKMTSTAWGSVRNTLTVGAGAMAIGGGFILGSSLKKAMDYESQLASIQALTGINNEELKKMDDLALKMGADTKYSALQAAQGIEELLKAGMSPATVQAGGLEAALNLATAGGLDLTEAAITLSDALNGFKKDGMSAADAANILAGAANASSTDVHKLSEALSQIGPVADGIGVPFRAVNATLAAFSNNMLKGSDAGTSLKTFLANVQPKTKEATALFEKYGLATANGANNVFFANGKLKDMAEVAGILQTKLKGLNEQQLSDVMNDLFGSDAQRAALILYKEGAEGIQKMYKEMADVTALEVAKKKMDTAAGSIEQFRGAIETMQIRALRPTLPLIKKVFQEAGDIVEKYTPVITRAIEGGVNRAKNYVKTHFMNNPDFQKLSAQGKFEFIMKDFKSTFDAWYKGGGDKQISSATSSLIGYVSEALKGSSDQLAAIGVDLGKSIASGMLDGLEQFAKENPKMAALFTFIATPGPLPVKFAAAVGIGSGIVPSIAESTSKDVSQFSESVEKNGFFGGLYDRFVTNLKDMAGGVTDENGNRLTGKAASEYLKNHPVYGPPEPSKSWLSSSVPAKTGGDTYNFAPVINGGNASDVIPALKEQQDDFVEQMKNAQRQQRRVSYGED